MRPTSLLALHRPVTIAIARLHLRHACPPKNDDDPKEEDFIRFYRDAVIAGHDDPAAETMRHFNLSRDYIVRLLNETIAGCEGQDIRNWKSGDR
jgi:hypothetical protein